MLVDINKRNASGETPLHQVVIKVSIHRAPHRHSGLADGVAIAPRGSLAMEADEGHSAEAVPFAFCAHAPVSTHNRHSPFPVLSHKCSKCSTSAAVLHLICVAIPQICRAISRWHNASLRALRWAWDCI